MKVARALVAFMDGSFLYVDLSRKPEPADENLFLEAVVGLPNGAPADKATTATSVARLAGAGKVIELVIPMARITGVSIQEDYADKSIKQDVAELWSAR